MQMRLSYDGLDHTSKCVHLPGLSLLICEERALLR